VTDLTDNDIRLILELVEKSNFDYLELTFGGVRLKVGKELPLNLDGADWAEGAKVTPPGTRQHPGTEPLVAKDVADLRTPAPEQGLVADIGPISAQIPIVAPSVGIFYARPEPSAPPFVRKGATVDAETTVCLIEVMKLYNSVPAGRSGVIAEVLVDDGVFVEYGQPLFLLQLTVALTDDA
jgi:biotin carboxyl carrier protein